MCKGTNTVQTNSSPPAGVLGAYQNIYDQASNVAAQPYQNYPGQIVAPWTNAQNQSLNEVTNAQYAAQPYINEAQGDFQNATTPLYQNVNQYESPYINDVVNSTQQQFNNQNAIQQQGIVGNAVSQGAWGGDRSAIAQAVTAGQQQANQAPVIAGLYNSGYNTALGAEEAQGWLGSQAGSGIAGLGAENLNSQLTGANALYGAGAQQQTQSQAELNVPYQEFLAQQAYPFQTTGWLGNIVGGLGGASGGTSSTTSPAASPISQLAGLGLGSLGIAGATGGFGSNGYLTGANGLFSQLGSASASVDPGIFAGGTTGASLAPELLETAAAALRRGGRIPPRDAGGPISVGDIPYQQTPPLSGAVPQVGISVIPQPHQMPHTGGMGPPRAPQGIAPGQNPPGSLDFSPSGIMGMLKNSGATGQNGWLSQINTSKQGGRIVRRADGGIVPVSSIEDFTAPGGLLDALTEHMRRGGIVPRYDDGGDVATAPIPPIDPTVYGSGLAPATGDSGVGISYQVPADLRAGIAPAAPVTDMPGGTNGIVPSDTSVKSDGWEKAWPLIKHYESRDGENVPNYRYDETHTASGVGQITDTNWHNLAPDLGIDVKKYPTAMSAPEDDQEKVAHQLYSLDRARGGSGYGDWAPYNPALAQAVGDPSARVHLAQRGDVASDVSGGIAPSTAITPTASGVGIVPRASSMSPSDASSLAGSGVSPWLALAAAGFGIAGGRSPSALQNIGSGALEGLKVLEQERQAQPELRLKSAQADLAQAQVGTYKAQQDWQRAQGTPAGASSSQPTGANSLDKRIQEVTQSLAGGPETSATQVTPSQAVAPHQGGSTRATETTASGTAATAGQSIPYGSTAQPGTPAWYDAQYGQIQNSINQLRTLPVPPGQMLQLQEQLIAKQAQLANLRQHDPRIVAAEATAKIAPALQQKQGESDIDYQNRIRTLNAENPILAAREGANEQAKTGPLLARKQGESDIEYNNRMRTPVVVPTSERLVVPGQLAGAQGTPAGAGTAQPGQNPAGVLQNAPSPIQKEIFNRTDADALKQLENIDTQATAARENVANAQAITDLMPRVKMGWGANEVQEGARILSSLGVSNDAIKQFLNTDPSAGDSLNKLFLKFSADAVRTLGAREPGSVINLFARAYPNLETSPHAAELMTNALRMQQQWKVDMSSAANQWLRDQRQNVGPNGEGYQGMIGFQQAFAKDHDPQLYWQAAEAMSGEGDIAWRKARTPEQRTAVYNLIPSGQTYIAPDGVARVKQ